jgi:hypothetical protein
MSPEAGISPADGQAIPRPDPAPSLKFLLHHPAHLVACGIGSGLSRWAPGTAGTAFAWLSYPYLRMYLEGDLGFAIFLLLAFARRRFRLPDHRPRAGRGRPWRHRLGRNRALLGC